MKTFYKIGFFVLLLAIVSGGAFFLGQNQEKFFPFFQKPSPTPQPTEAIFPTSTISQTQSPNSPTPTIKPKISINDLKANIKDAVSSKNYAALEGYMLDKVSVVLESTECCGAMSKVDVVNQMDYLKSATLPWNFDDANPIAAQLRAADPSDYGPADSIIGIAANDYVVVFKLNAENKISGITMAVTYKLVVP